MTHRTIRALALVSGLILSAGTQARAVDVRAVTEGLRPAVSLNGQAPVRYTLSDEMDRLHVPGVSIAVIRDGRIAWSQGFGVTGADGRSVTADTVFQAGSVSKPVAATAALHLVQSGRLSLDAPVNDTLKHWKLPENTFTAAKPVTLRMLLSHTAGTTVHGFEGYAAGQTVPTLIQVLNGEVPANSKPVVVDQAVDTAYRYSGGGYSIVQQMMIDATAMTFPELLDQTVLKPIGMTHSTFAQPGQRTGNLAQPHTSQGLPVAGGPHTYPEMAAAGLWTTAPDLAAYVIEMQKALRGESGVMTAALARDMMTRGKGNVGLAFTIGGSDANPYFYHDGSNAGYKATLVGYGKTGDGAIILTNGDQGYQLGLEILRGIATAYNWPDFQPVERRAVSLPLAEQVRFAGTFTIADVGDFEIRAEGGRLVAEIWKGVVEPLYPESPKSFFITSQVLDISFVDKDHGTLKLNGYNAEFRRSDTRGAAP